MTQDCQTNGLQSNFISMEIPYPISPGSFLEPSIQPCTQTGSYFTLWPKAHSLGMLCQHMAYTAQYPDM